MEKGDTETAEVVKKYKNEEEENRDTQESWKKFYLLNIHNRNVDT